MPAYTLYYSPGSASLVVHWLFLDTGLPHELRRLDLAAGEHKQPAYLAINPNGVVPTLLIDGVPMLESSAMVMQLADAHPEAALAPPPGSAQRAVYYQWIVIGANGLQPAFRTWFYPNEAAGEASADMAKAAARERIEAIWTQLDAHLAANGPYILGATPSAADFYLTMLMRWSRNMPRTATAWPHLAMLAARMKARPSFARLYEIEGLTEWA
jgi:glutathione S-transferase